MSKMTPEAWRAKLDALPQPLEGPSPWDRKDAMTGDDAYQLAGELTAKAMLICADADPTLLDIPADQDDPSMYDAAWKAATERWPGLDDWLGGITLNMFGWANATVRYIHGKPQVGNPAVITISIPS